MKLRLRNLETKETLRLEIPSPSTLLQLQQTLSQSLSLSSSLYFSLNRKDSLHVSSPHDSLSSLGITSGDLIYFSLDPSSFSPIPQIPGNSKSQESEISQETQVFGLDYPNQETPVQDLTVQRQQTAESDMADTNLDSNTQIEENQETEDTQMEENQENMDIDIVVAGKKFSEPYFLRRVLREELGEDGSNHKLLVIAVHAVLLESGFVGFDLVSGLRVDKFHLPDEWPSAVSLSYTLPELLGNALNEYVVLKFQSLGHFVNVYGSLSNGGSSLYRVCLDQYRFVPTIDLVWANCDKNEDNKDGSSSSNSYPENEVFEFWKIVKDGLALPLLIDICDRNGLVLPACLMRLPTELKVKILESLGGVDVAKMGCVCTEMRYLSSNNDLWKQKCGEEFGDEKGARERMIGWKQRFAFSWISRKKTRMRMITQQRGRVGRGPLYFPFRRDPFAFGQPMMIGGDYDRLPRLGIPSLFGQPGRALPRRSFSPPCDLGGFHA